MSENPRKKSPRAPSIPLDEAVERAMRAYDKGRLQAAPVDVIAQHIGYKTANNGAALQALASLRYFGLLERPKEGLLAVTKDVEAYRLAPEPHIARSLLLRFLRAPALFAELLDKYQGGLPSDGNLKDELIQRGFLPSTASSLAAVFRRSVEVARYYEHSQPEQVVAVPQADFQAFLNDAPASGPTVERAMARPRIAEPGDGAKPLPGDGGHDRIPVRLPGGRRAFLLIPSVFYEADKQRLKAQIDLLLTEDGK